MSVRSSKALSSLWEDLDSFDASDEVEDGLDQADQYHQIVEGEVKRKQNVVATDKRVIHRDFALIGDEGGSDSVTSAEDNLDRSAVQDRTSLSQAPFSFNPSSILQTSAPKTHFPATFPHVPTPSPTTTSYLPPPPPVKSAQQNTPVPVPRSTDPGDGHIATPSFTPNNSNSASNHSRILNISIGEGRGRRDDPATPVPLGTSRLQGKKEWQKFNSHFEAFACKLAKSNSAGNVGASTKGKGRGRHHLVKSTSMQGLGGKIFQGLRFCIPPEINQERKHEGWWKIITDLGGTVTVQPDTAVTHVISDRHKSKSALAKDLGLELLSDLPAGTVCIKWAWVKECKLAGRLYDTVQFFTFPQTTLTNLSTSTKSLAPASSRLFDISDQLRGRSITSISRHREHTASDSETDSQKRPRPNISDPLVMQPPQAKIARTTSVVPNTETTHVLPTGPGWVKAAESEADALDDMINGIVQGNIKVVDDEESDKEGDRDVTGMSSFPKPDNSSPAAGKVGSNIGWDDRKLSRISSLLQTSQSLAEKFKCGQSHDGTPSQGPNEALAKKFEDMYAMYEGRQGKNRYAIQQYRRAAGIMRRIPYPITSKEQASAIHGIGDSMAQRIHEFLTGEQGRADFEDDEQTRTVMIFKDIYGVGKTFANQLYQRGARSIEDLRTKDYGLTEGQKIGVQLYEDLTTRIPREECKQIFDIIKEEAIGLDPKLWIEIMGSYRRGSKDSGDVDILITRDTSDGLTHTGILPRLIKALKLRGVITHDLGTPSNPTALEAKWMGVGKVNYTGRHRRIDILCIPFENWGAALIYFTGNEIFNRSLRLYASKLGYRLNQRGLYKDVIRGKDRVKLTEGEIVASKTEQEIFDVLGIRWRHPHQRRP